MNNGSSLGSLADKFCAINESGVVQCFEFRLSGDEVLVTSIEIPMTASASEIRMGRRGLENAVCVRDQSTGRIQCFNFNTGELWAGGPPEGLSFTTFDVASNQVCGILQDGRTLSCWDGDGEEIPPPSQAQFRSLRSHAGQICAVREIDRLLECMTFGESPPRISPPYDVKFESVSEGHGRCALAIGGALHCW